ncbi:primosomal protein DnaI [Listeria fleischmannii FSL S10-1203]|uniref:Primosomal protein DnaI n=1 Tax=Listeria fleischmannii FSL S10-1203 TaxID=1265822 RepID=W7DJ57_9LIST|nr:primosomal protein DnaI [Listeria fleischmannii FSL S10-1203]
MKQVDKIERTLGQLFEGRDFEKEYQEVKEKVLSYEPIRQFLMENKADISEQMINQNISNLYEFMTQDQNFKEKKRNADAWLCTKTCLKR